MGSISYSEEMSTVYDREKCGRRGFSPHMIAVSAPRDTISCVEMREAGDREVKLACVKIVRRVIVVLKINYYYYYDMHKAGARDGPTMVLHNLFLLSYLGSCRENDARERRIMRSVHVIAA